MTTVLDALNHALLRAMQDSPDVILMGEDILDPYGGAFKVTRGLSSTFPNRVLPFPISEAALAGVAAGMALRGLRPVIEFMFGDFITLAADQVINHIARLPWMYNRQVRLPLVMRAPMGGRRGYGPSHSQTLEKLFMGAPGLTILAPVNFPGVQPGVAEPEELLYHAVLEQDEPVLFVENKLQYLLPVLDAKTLGDFEIKVELCAGYPVYTLSIRSAPPPVITLASYGYMAELARRAMWTLASEHEIFTQLVVPTCLTPFDSTGILDSLSHTGRLMTIEEGTLSLGWGAEVAACAAEAMGPGLLRLKRLAAADSAVPASPVLENAVLPGITEIIETARRMV